MGMGYQGFVRIFENGGTPPTNPIVLLATGASVNLILEPIYSTSVWGAGWYNASTTSHYADGPIRFEGTVDIELQTNETWEFLRQWAVDRRAFPRSLDISPDGVFLYQYHTAAAYGTPTQCSATLGAWCSSFDLSTSEGSFVTASTGITALNRNEIQLGVDNTNPSGTGNPAITYCTQQFGVVGGDYASSFGPSNPLNPCADNVNPIPFWKTQAFIYDLEAERTGSCALDTSVMPYSVFDDTFGTPLGNSGGGDPHQTVEWNISLANNPVLLNTMDGSPNPSAILQGPIDVTGSVILYNASGIESPIDPQTGELRTPAESTNFRIQISTDKDDTNQVYIECPAIVIESDDYSIQGQDSITNRTYNFKGLGGRLATGVGSGSLPASMADAALPPMLMSNLAGELSDPSVDSDV